MEIFIGVERDVGEAEPERTVVGGRSRKQGLRINVSGVQFLQKTTPGVHLIAVFKIINLVVYT